MIRRTRASPTLIAAMAFLGFAVSLLALKLLLPARNDVQRVEQNLQDVGLVSTSVSAPYSPARNSESELPGRNLSIAQTDPVESDHPVDPGIVVPVSQRTGDFPETLAQAEGKYDEADRIGVIAIDQDRLLDRLGYTSAFLYAQAGQRSAPPYKNSTPDLYFSIFPDEIMGLQVESVEILGSTTEPGNTIIFSGRIVSGGAGTFRLLTADDKYHFSGSIELEEGRISFTTWKGDKVTAVAEYKQETLESMDWSID